MEPGLFEFSNILPQMSYGKGCSLPITLVILARKQSRPTRPACPVFPNCPGPPHTLAPASVHVAYASGGLAHQGLRLSLGSGPKIDGVHRRGEAEHPCPLASAQQGASAGSLFRRLVKARAQPPQSPPSANPCPSWSLHSGTSQEGSCLPPHSPGRDCSRVLGYSSCSLENGEGETLRLPRKLSSG